MNYHLLYYVKNPATGAMRYADSVDYFSLEAALKGVKFLFDTYGAEIHHVSVFDDIEWKNYNDTRLNFDTSPMYDPEKDI